MPSPTADEIYCPNINCGSESWSTANGVSIKTRRHRRMNYAGAKKVGAVRVILINITEPGDPIERGTYYFYFCPVCGRRAAVHDKWGVNRLILE